MMYKLYMDRAMMDIITIEKYYNSENRRTDIKIFIGDSESPMNYIFYSGNEKLFLITLSNVKEMVVRAHHDGRYKNTFLLLSGQTCSCIEKSDLYISLDQDAYTAVVTTIPQQRNVNYIEIYNEDDIVE